MAASPPLQQTPPFDCHIQFSGQRLQDSRLQAPVWSGTITSAHQRYRTVGALPRAPTSLYSQYPVLWFECGSFEGQFGVSELIKFLDDNNNRKTPKNRNQAPEGQTNLKCFWGGTEHERLGQLIKLPESSRSLRSLFLCGRRLHLSALTSIKLKLCDLPWVPLFTAYSHTIFL